MTFMNQMRSLRSRLWREKRHAEQAILTGASHGEYFLVGLLVRLDNVGDVTHREFKKTTAPGEEEG